MRLGWDEIKRRARAFSEEWKHAHYEKGDTQTFYNEFFEIFGMRRRQVAVFEKRVQALDASRRGFIDLFWPGVLIAEQKSAGRRLTATQSISTLALRPADASRNVAICNRLNFVPVLVVKRLALSRQGSVMRL